MVRAVTGAGAAYEPFNLPSMSIPNADTGIETSCYDPLAIKRDGVYLTEMAI